MPDPSLVGNSESDQPNTTYGKLDTITWGAIVLNHQTGHWTVRTELPIKYEIVQTNDLLDPANPELCALPGGGRSDATRLVILDDSIRDLYGQSIENYFEVNGVPVDYLTLPATEEAKSIESVLKVVWKLDEVGTQRVSTPPVVIGGGVLADVVGLAASLYRRGIPYIRVPTTLLGQVDVSASAKTGINHRGYRNRLGTYSPPPLTLIDLGFLGTLPPRQLRNGMAEIFKMALVRDPYLFELLEEHGGELIESRFQEGKANEAGDSVARDVIGRSVSRMVEELEPNLWEKNLQRPADYGHSFSPLVEMRALPELLHGEAVAMDCVFSAVLATGRGLLGDADRTRIVGAARRLGLRTSHPLFCDSDLLAEALADTTRHRNGQQNLPMLTRIGGVCFLNDITANEIKEAATEMSRLLEEEHGTLEAAGATR
jgi:3-dehydroquinate synthetase